MVLRRSYERELVARIRDARFGKGKEARKRRREAQQAIKKIANTLRGKNPKVLITDRGYRGGDPGPEIKLVIPETGKGKNESEKRRTKTRFRRRSKVEAVIGHLKSDYGLLRNYLKGAIGDAINLMLAAAAYNCKKWKSEMAARPLFLFFVLFLIVNDMARFSFPKLLKGDFTFANG